MKKQKTYPGKTLTPNTKLDFGKFKGTRVKDAPDWYINWLKENTNHKIVTGDSPTKTPTRYSPRDTSTKITQPISTITRIPLHESSIHREFGREYEDQIPAYHIEGAECTIEEYYHYLKQGEERTHTWLKGEVFKKIRGEKYSVTIGR